jgi:hypothetical protein
MLRRVMMVLATTVALTGALSAGAFARGGGSPVGPMGQIFDGVNPVDHPFIFGPAGQRYYAYGAGKAYGDAYDYAGVPDARPHKKANNH